MAYTYKKLSWGSRIELRCEECEGISSLWKVGHSTPEGENSRCKGLRVGRGWLCSRDEKKTLQTNG